MTQGPGRLSEFLSRIGLERLRDRLAAEDVDMSVLPLLDEEDLKGLGLNLGERKRLLRAVAELGARAEGGAPPRDDALAGAVQLRRLSVLFCDMVGATRLGEELGIDRMQIVLQRYCQTAQRIAARHDGHLAMSQGDGLVLLFGYPRVVEGFAERCVAAASELQGALARAPVTFAGRAPVRIATRIGIASGQALVGERGEDAPGGVHLVGPAVNRAARLQALARPNAIIVDRATRELTAAAVAYGAPRSVRLRGFSEPAEVFRVVGMSAPAADRPVALLDRAAETALLRKLWRRARRGHPATLTIHGGPGIGKSALVQHFLTREVGPSARVIRLRASAMATHSPLRPVAEALAELTGPDPPPAALAALLGAAPESAERTARFVGLAAAPEGDAGSGADERAAILDLLARWIVAGDDRPTAAVLENAQWADDATRALLSRAARQAQLEGSRFLMIVVTRDDAPPPGFDQGRDRALALPPLPEDAANLLLDRALSGAPIPQSVREHILRRSDGNPLMLESLGHALRRRRLAELADAVEVPHTIYESVAMRLDALSAGREAIEALAALGAPADPALLGRILRADAGTVDAALAALDRAGLIERTLAHGRETIAFRHQVCRDVVLERLAGPARERLHLAVYRALAREGGAPHRPDILARHALAGRDWANAARHALEAGLGYLVRSALPEAGRHLDMAMDALARLPAGPEVDRDRLRAVAGLAAVERSRFGIASDRSAELGRQAVALARAVGDAKAELLALNGLYSHALVRADYRRADSFAKALSKAAERCADDDFRMIGGRAIGAVALHRGDQATARRRLERALAQYERDAHLPLAHAHGYDHAEICAALLAMSLWIGGDLRGARRMGAWAIAHARAIDHAHSLAQAISFRVMWGALARQGAEMAELAAEGVALSEKHGIRVMRAAARLFPFAGGLCLQPDAPAAAQMADLASRVAEFRAANPFNYVPLLNSVLAEAHLRAGDLPAAQIALAEAQKAEARTEETWTCAEVLRMRARLAAAQGDGKAARRLRGRALGAARRTQAATIALRIACDMAEADPRPATAGAVRAALARLTSRDGGWDVRRAAAILRAGAHG
ncbi:ATP-binding protein [Oceanicella actignis]|uniref:SAM domain (Sterile alpha motif) n=1 Tax=Oceanicella actignis TaxID=1189325 RepID=A0A1M7T8R1_9RHOB|nr:AAA family ATPase [Oceanicella actignis]SET49854.1 SAM domain (Sterile alpha motif) [Oceanicella actignis]SHN67096.1 SAM domain (Sterile alpha motif) [Oceanicella actignis]